jgi:hypothetical protein
MEILPGTKRDDMTGIIGNLETIIRIIRNNKQQAIMKLSQFQVQGLIKTKAVRIRKVSI